MIITNETRAGLFSKETLLNLSKKVCFTSFVSFDRCGRYISTKNMVPINRKELKSPKSLNAIESNDTKAKNVFLNRLHTLEQYDTCDIEKLKDIFLGIYSTPVTNK